MKQPVTSVDESPDEPEINIFPNPATDLVNISNNSYFTQAEIIDMKGQIHSTWKLLAGDSQVIITALPSGVYFLRLTGSGMAARHTRLVKQ
jgi:hypothetical protein